MKKFGEFLYLLDTNGGHLFFLSAWLSICIAVCIIASMIGDKAKLLFDLTYTLAAGFSGALTYAMKAGNKTNGVTK